jgi:hypothetical protein
MPEIQKNNTVQLSIHVIIWVIILFFPMIFIYGEGERNIIRYLDFSLPIILLMVVFYANYTIIISRFLFNKKIWQFFLANLLLFAICLILLDQIRQFYFYPFYAQLEELKHSAHRDNMRQIILFRDVISMSITAGLATAINTMVQVAGGAKGTRKTSYRIGTSEPETPA